MAKKIKNKIPRYFGLRIYLLSTILYFLLVFPVSGILTFKYGPEWMKNDTSQVVVLQPEGVQLSFNRGPNDSTRLFNGNNESLFDTIIDLSGISDSLSGLIRDTAAFIAEGPIIVNPAQSSPIDEIDGGNNEFAGTVGLLVRLLIISFLLGLAFNLPFKIYFRKLRRGEKVSPKLFRFCKKLLLKTPIINAGILFLSYGIVLGYMAYILFIESDFHPITQKFYNQFFFITLVSSLLTLLFVFYWQRHRVHIRYIEHIYTPDELKRSIFKNSEGRIKNRLWVASAMTTLLPLTIVVFYLFISVTAVKDIDVGELQQEHIDILVGNYSTYIEGNTNVNEFINELFFVNAFDSILMFGGIITGILMALIYILFFVRWTTQDITLPVRELLNNMERIGRGELNSFGIVRTNDEIGELTEGYNEMTDKLREHIINISRINEANARFVPRQFLEYLGKESISDIRLGDQIQKEMTILFTDIRDFTTISEHMSPKENFNFLNNYLGYMEPVIRHNNGFIDKFIGDSIMALFPDKAEDAINAAIEMKIKLQEFNHIISQFGQPPIKTGIGIHTGNLMLGVVGGEGRMDGTVISDAVNLTSRLEGLTKVYGSSIVISEDTLINISDPSNYNYRFLDIVKVKGKKKAIYIFEVLDGDNEEIKSLKLQTKEEFSKAIQYYKDKKFQEAMELFLEIIKINPNDLAAQNYLERCRKFIDLGFPDDWDGIERFY